MLFTPFYISNADFYIVLNLFRDVLNILGYWSLGLFLTPAAGMCTNGSLVAVIGDAKLLAIKFSTAVSACREAALMKICESPHVARLLDSFTSASLTCLVMPHYDTTLGNVLLDSPCSFLQIGGSVLSSFSIFTDWGFLTF